MCWIGLGHRRGSLHRDFRLVPIKSTGCAKLTIYCRHCGKLIANRY